MLRPSVEKLWCLQGVRRRLVSLKRHVQRAKEHRWNERGVTPPPPSHFSPSLGIFAYSKRKVSQFTLCFRELALHVEMRLGKRKSRIRDTR